MARPFPTNIKQQSSGKLLVEEYHPGFNQVYFVPPKEKLEESGLDTRNTEMFKNHILDIISQNDHVCIYPLNTLAGHENFLKPKYEDVESITLEGFDLGISKNSDEVVDLLEALPAAFFEGL